MKTVSRVADGKLGVATINCVSGEARVITEICSARLAISALAICPTKPWDAHTLADCECGSGLSAATVGTLRSLPHFFADFFDSPDNLMTQNQWQFRIGQFAI